MLACTLDIDVVRLQYMRLLIGSGILDTLCTWTGMLMETMFLLVRLVLTVDPNQALSLPRNAIPVDRNHARGNVIPGLCQCWMRLSVLQV